MGIGFRVILIWVRFLGVPFAEGEGWVKLPPVKHSLELWEKLEIWCVLTYTQAVSENISFNTKNTLILPMLAFYFFFVAKNQHFEAKISPLFKAIV